MDLHRILNDWPENEGSDAVASEGEQHEADFPSPASPHQQAGFRVGVWSHEEERFTLELTRRFLDGVLDVPSGTTLRNFLSTTLRCSPMRVSTKLATESLAGERIPKRIGQKRFFPALHIDEAARAAILRRLRELEDAFVRTAPGASIGPAGDPCVSPRSVCGRVAARSSVLSPREHRDRYHRPLRVGGWSDEEQEYALAIIDAFLRGQMDLPRGTTLRSYLAERLRCNAMRVSKKLATGMMANHKIPSRIGSASFQPSCNDADIQKTAHVARDLERLRALCFRPTGMRKLL